jgi:hypothetical protein
MLRGTTRPTIANKKGALTPFFWLCFWMSLGLPSLIERGVSTPFYYYYYYFVLVGVVQKLCSLPLQTEREEGELQIPFLCASKCSWTNELHSFSSPIEGGTFLLFSCFCPLLLGAARPTIANIPKTWAPYFLF